MLKKRESSSVSVPALLTFQHFTHEQGSIYKMAKKIPLLGYISDVLRGCVFWTVLLLIIREFLQTSYVMFLAALVAPRGLSPDVNTQESPSTAFFFECKNTPERCFSNHGFRGISFQSQARGTLSFIDPFSVWRAEQSLFWSFLWTEKCGHLIWIA